MAARRRGARPRWGRIGAAGLALATTLVSLVGATGTWSDQAAASPTPRARLTSSGAAATSPQPTVTPTPSPSPTAADEDTSLPAGSGTGKRVVFDLSAQRVWLVDRRERVRRTYLVSGSLTDNLGPGTYAVYSHSRWAVGIDDSGVMQYFVRFTRGAHAAIGFHSIPTKDGEPLQTLGQLGTPQSHGCIRQALPDAKILYAFAPVGTKVVVTA